MVITCLSFSKKVSEPIVGLTKAQSNAFFSISLSFLLRIPSPFYSTLSFLFSLLYIVDVLLSCFTIVLPRQ